MGYLVRQPLRSIRFKLTAIAVVLAIVPALVLGIIHYTHNRQLIETSVSQRLDGSASRFARELSLWVASRQSDLRVAASSYLVLENLDRALAGDVSARRQVTEYLESVNSRLPAFNKLSLLDQTGNLIAGDTPLSSGFNLNQPLARFVEPSTLLDHSGTDEQLMVMNFPILDLENQVRGVMMAETALLSLQDLMELSLTSPDIASYLVDSRQHIVLSSGNTNSSVGEHFATEVIERLRMSTLMPYWHADGTEVVGVMHPVPGTDWNIIVEQSRSSAYSEISTLQSSSMVIGALILLVILLVASVSGRGISSPLVRLRQAAKRVSEGDLSARVEPKGNDELADLTQMFNNMVSALKTTRDELDRNNAELAKRNRIFRTMSRTDALTGLPNRQHLNNWLPRMLAHAKRLDKPLAIMMLDVDHFKRINDDQGHFVGDAALTKIATRIRGVLNFRDYAARFGGEEFLVALWNCNAQQTEIRAEHLRTRIAQDPFMLNDVPCDITVSLGIATFPECSDALEELLVAADDALYRAKADGRNCIKHAHPHNLRIVSSE